MFEEIFKKQQEQKIHILKSIDHTKSIEKMLNGDIEKARSGVYSNTPENRKKGRVGQKYGSSKKEQGSDLDKRVVANNNYKKVNEYLKNVGAEKVGSGMYGSSYYNYKGNKVRVSNHHWTSEKHYAPDINLYSYEKDGYKGLIQKLKDLKEFKPKEIKSTFKEYKINHKRFGDGVVISETGDKIQIRFKDAGFKTLIKRFAEREIKKI